MRLDGRVMIVRLKDAFKLIGIMIISCCAVFVCTLFLNYNLDLDLVREQITGPQAMEYYDAQKMTIKVVVALSGGCLLLTSVILLLFYIRHYIDTHRKELGILKALGYSNFKIAKGFWVFGSSVFAGAGTGYCAAFAIMPYFYSIQNENGFFPDVPIHFNISVAVYLVIVPALAFALLAVGYGYRRLRCPVLQLLKDKAGLPGRSKRIADNRQRDMTFLQELKKSTVKSRTSLVFFIVFASFCYSSMMQMACSMDELASEMMSAIILVIGIVLACTTLFLAVTTVVNANTQTISMMKVFGYSFRECSSAILGGYRPMAYAGFMLGTVYQYALLKIMVSVVFKNIENVPDYSFDWTAFMLVLITFAVIYEVIMRGYTARIKRISVKEVMLE